MADKITREAAKLLFQLSNLSENYGSPSSSASRDILKWAIELIKNKQVAADAILNNFASLNIKITDYDSLRTLDNLIDTIARKTKLLPDKLCFSSDNPDILIQMAKEGGAKAISLTNNLSEIPFKNFPPAKRLKFAIAMAANSPELAATIADNFDTLHLEDISHQDFLKLADAILTQCRFAVDTLIFKVPSHFTSEQRFKVAELIVEKAINMENLVESLFFNKKALYTQNSKGYTAFDLAQLVQRKNKEGSKALAACVDNIKHLSAEQRSRLKSSVTA